MKKKNKKHSGQLNFLSTIERHLAWLDILTLHNCSPSMNTNIAKLVVQTDYCNTSTKSSKSFPKCEAYDIGKYAHFYEVMKKYFI